MPTIILQITMLLFVKWEDLYWLIYILIVLCYDKEKRGDIMRIQKCYMGYCAVIHCARLCNTEDGSVY